MTEEMARNLDNRVKKLDRGWIVRDSDGIVRRYINSNDPDTGKPRALEVTTLGDEAFMREIWGTPDEETDLAEWAKLTETVDTANRLEEIHQKVLELYLNLREGYRRSDEVDRGVVIGWMMDILYIIEKE